MQNPTQIKQTRVSYIKVKLIIHIHKIQIWYTSNVHFSESTLKQPTLTRARFNLHICISRIATRNSRPRLRFAMHNYAWRMTCPHYLPRKFSQTSNRLEAASVSPSRPSSPTLMSTYVLRRRLWITSLSFGDEILINFRNIPTARQFGGGGGGGRMSRPALVRRNLSCTIMAMNFCFICGAN